MSLDRRCSPCIITSDEIICEGFDVSKLKKDFNSRGENRYSPIEAYIKIFPEKKMVSLPSLIVMDPVPQMKKVRFVVKLR